MALGKDTLYSNILSQTVDTHIDYQLMSCRHGDICMAHTLQGLADKAGTKEAPLQFNEASNSSLKQREWFN